MLHVPGKNKTTKTVQKGTKDSISVPLLFVKVCFLRYVKVKEAKFLFLLKPSSGREDINTKRKSSNILEYSCYKTNQQNNNNKLAVNK